ncbi:MAG: UTP--glucose-1-phosphate uridylyltransferase [Caldilineaceae bacterium]|nr:UTP--glucose-1-phosphate uridylyltransferase [Caldilineaceae bacterium]
MKITKALITAAGRRQRTLPLQTLIDRDGVERSVLHILLNEVVQAGVESIGVVVWPGDERAYAAVAGDHVGRLHFVPQSEPLGYGHALYAARDFIGDAPFLHLVGDHLYVQRDSQSCVQPVMEVAQTAECTVSAVQATRESLLPYYGVIGGRRIQGHSDLYRVDTVMEKPTPTVAEQNLLIPGLRSGHYLCFFGMHVLTPTVMEILGRQLAEAQPDSMAKVTLSSALAELSGREQYLALEQQNSRYDLGVRYGLLSAQVALALNGQDRDEVLARLLELLAQRDLAGVR